MLFRNRFFLLRIYGYYILYSLFLLLLEIALVILFLYPDLKNFSQVIIYLMAIISIAIINILPMIFWIKIDEKYILNAPESYEIKDGKEYIGIVITNSNLPDSKLIFIYGSGLMLFLDYLIKNKKPFKLIKQNNRENKFNKKEFENLIYDKNCQELYILGHGKRHALKISAKEYLYYFLYANAPKKRKVIQLHCNTGKYVSLSELLHAKKDFKEKGYRWLLQDLKYFLDKSK